LKKQHEAAKITRKRARKRRNRWIKIRRKNGNERVMNRRRGERRIGQKEGNVGRSIKEGNRKRDESRQREEQAWTA